MAKVEYRRTIFAKSSVLHGGAMSATVAACHGQRESGEVITRSYKGGEHISAVVPSFRGF